MSGEGKSKGGRRPTLLEINPNAYWTIGIDVDEERIFAGIVDLKGSIVREVGRTRCRFKSQDDFLDAVKQVIRELMSAIPSTTPLLGAGIGIPGFVDRVKGIALHCSYYDWMRDVPVRQLLEKEFGFPIADRQRYGRRHPGGEVVRGGKGGRGTSCTPTWARPWEWAS